ncbi:hypothetical protein [Nocardioides sambongensis]|uniref:hypothetical protein n=1 Tax=Nocardioides sambongensis TaxID=2589074 RepID=UPI0015E85092|nr:hypothetical protein [Nocardioides sambongensis]
MKVVKAKNRLKGKQPWPGDSLALGNRGFRGFRGSADRVWPAGQVDPTQVVLARCDSRRAFGQRIARVAAWLCASSRAGRLPARPVPVRLSTTLGNEAVPSLENEATGSSSSSLPGLGF